MVLTEFNEEVFVKSIREEGWEDGWEKGQKDGWEKGQNQARRSVALEMLKAKLPYDSIMQFTKFSAEELGELEQSLTSSL